MEIALNTLKAICLNILHSSGFSPPEAEAIFSEVLWAEASGKTSHGLFALPRLISRFTHTRTSFSVLQEGPSWATIDGGGGVGQIVGKTAIELAISKAQTTGVGIVGVRRMMPYLCPGYYAEMAAVTGFLGIVANNCTPEVAPFGGIDPILGTNPMAVGIPTGSYPLLLDFATSERSMGEIRLKAKHGETLPETWATDSSGRAAYEPEAVHALRSFGGYKGYALGLVLECAIAGLTGSKASLNIAGPLDWGYVFAAIDVGTIAIRGSFEKSVSSVIDCLGNSRTANANCKITYPGRNSGEKLRHTLAEGRLTIDPLVLRELEALCPSPQASPDEHSWTNGPHAIAPVSN